MTDALLFLAMMAGVAAAALLVARSPAFWAGLGKLLIMQFLPRALKIFKPKPFTKEQLDKIARGQDPFREREKGW